MKSRLALSENVFVIYKNPERNIVISLESSQLSEMQRFDAKQYSLSMPNTNSSCNKAVSAFEFKKTI